jgi:hypothetical protein
MPAEQAVRLIRRDKPGGSLNRWIRLVGLVQRQAKDFGCRSAEATTIHGWPEKHDPNSLA